MSFGSSGSSAFFSRYLVLAPQFVTPWDAAHEIDDLDVEEWRPDLERMHHARAIHLGQDVVLQIELGVELQRPVDQRAAPAGLPLLDRLRVDVLEIDASRRNTPPDRRGRAAPSRPGTTASAGDRARAAFAST